MVDKKTKIFYCITYLLLFVISIFSVGINNPTNISASAENQAETLSQSAPQTIYELRNADDDQLNYWADNLETFDGRRLDIVTPTRNQGQRNICWAYAPIGAVESNILRKGIDKNAKITNLNLDERVLAYARFNRDGLHDPLCLTTEDTSCVGTWDLGDKGYNAYETMTEGYALVNQNEFLDLDDLDAINGELLQSEYYVQNYFKISTETNDIKRAILKYGAVSFSYASPRASDVKYYSGNNSYTTNHESLIVGWDDNVSSQEFTPNKPASNGAWIVKNSWGSYGDVYNGISCFYMSYQEHIVAPYVVDVAMRENYQNIYHYDGQISSVRSSADAEKQAAIYEAKLSTSTKQEQLTAATIYTDLGNIDVKVEVYKNLTVNSGDVNDEINNPEQGFSVANKVVHIGAAGFHTIDFDNPISLKQGEYFSIVVSSENANNKPVAACVPDKTSVNDMTYYFLDGKWESYKKSDNYADTAYSSYVAKIRAITNVVDRGEDLGKNIENARVEIDNRLVFYEKGQDMIPNVEVYFDEELLVRDTDYSLSVENNSSIGMATITIYGMGEYTGKRTTNFEVAKAKYPPGRMSGTVKVYDDIKMAHEIKIPNGWQWIGNDEELKLGKSQFQFSLKYVGSDANLYQNTVCGFFIEKIAGDPPARIDISETNVEILGSYVYTGEKIEPRVRVTYLGEELSDITDYELTFLNNTEAGEATVIVSGKGQYTGQNNQTFKIKKARWPSVKPKSAMFVNKDVTNLSQITLETDWTWQNTFDITSDKFQSVAVYNGTDKKNYGNTKMTVTITRGSETVQKNLSLLTLSLKENSFVYDGTKKEPEIIAKDGEYRLLKDTDFEVEYLENINAGSARAIVKGKNKYVGTKTLYFTINRADIQGFAVSQQGWTFGEVAPTPTVTGQVVTAKVTFTYSDKKDGTYVENTPTQAGNYWIKAVAEQSQNYNYAEAKAEFTIEKADRPNSVPNTKMTVGRKIETLRSVPLIDGWKWEEPNTKISAESITAWAEYSDKANYKNYRIQITLTKEPPKNVSYLSVDLDVKNFVYNGSEVTPSVIAKDGETLLTLGVDYDVQYENNKLAGQGRAIVTFKNDYIGSTQIEFTIEKAEKPTVNTTIYHNKNAAKLSDISLPDGFVWENENMEITGNRISAKAIYTGDDADSYKTTELTFEIVISEQEQPSLSDDPQQGKLIWLAIVIPVAVTVIALTGFALFKRKRNK